MRLPACLLLVFASYASCLAQSPALPSSLPSTGTVLPAPTTAQPVPDSVQQAVHKLFKRGRCYSLVAGLSGVCLLSSGILYTAREGVSLGSTPNILYGGGVAVAGAIGRARYSRRRERQALEALAAGYRLPAYAAEFAPLLPKRNREIIYRYL